MRTKAAPLTYEISDFSLGWDNINKATTLEKRTFTDIKNFNLSRRRGLEKRGGISDLYSTTAGADIDITSLYEYKAPDGNDYVLVATDTYIKSHYNAKWNNLKTGLTAGKKYSFETHRGLGYGVNGLDDNFKLRNTTSYNVGIAPPLGAPSVATASAGTASLYTNHGTANIDYIGELRQNSARSIMAQSFKLDRAYSVSSVKLKCRKIGTPTGNMTVEIHSDQVGTIVGAASANVVVADFTTEFATKEFTLGTAASCSANITYYIIIKSTHTPAAGAFVEVGFDWEGGYVDGQYFEIDSDTLSTATWTLFNSVDLGFEVWGTQVGAELQLEYGALDTGDNARLKKAMIEANEEYESYLLSQSFQLSAGRDVSSIKLALKKFGSPTGNLWVELHSSRTGTSGTKDASTNMVLNGSSDNVAVSSIGADSAWVTFTFSGTKPSLSASTDYYLMLYCDYNEHALNHISWTVNTNTYTSGKLWRIFYDDITYTWSAWDERGDSDEKDASFKIYGINTTAAAAESYSLSSITQIRDLREGTATTEQQMIVQSFTVDESGSCPYAKVYMSEVGTVSGNIWAEIHSQQYGTNASKDSSTYIVGSASANVTASDLSNFPTFGWVTFTFGTTDPPLTKGNTYYLVIYGDYGISKDNFASIALDKAPAGYSGGTKWEIDEAEAWTEVAGQDIIFEIYLTTGGLNATYYYRYTYKRTSWLETEGNPSDVSVSVAPTTGYDVDVGVVASSDTTQVDKIILYRTLANETTPFYKQGEYANTTATITDSVSDDGLTTLWDETNTVPPKATFIKLHGDRIFYANCPDEDEGGSLVMWSKSGNGEVVPSVNYQYFDKDDGEDITGVASVGDNFLVFKPNKIGILNTEVPELWYLGFGIGCIAPWAILTFKDKVIFLSEEGWKATDGKDIWDLSENINGLVEDKYLTIKEKENYSVAYYPEKEHFQFLINHSTEDPKVVVGHFLVPLLLKPTGISELVKQNIMGWTYHEYDYDELTCVGNYTDSDGITKIIAGASDGFVYLLDSGTDDDGEDITTRLRTDWLSLGAPRSITKTIRKGYLTYGTSGTISLGLTVDIDFAATDETTTLTGSAVDIDDSINESFPLTGTGELFRFTLLETSSKSLDLMGFTIQFRNEGVR